MNKRAVTVSGYVIFVSLFCQMKNQYIFRVIHIQSVHRASALMERGAEGLWARVGWGGGSRLFVCHNCTIAFSNPLVNISELM